MTKHSDEFDYGIVTRQMKRLLAEVYAGKCHFRHGIPALIKRGLVDHWLHHVEINRLGLLALNDLCVGARVESIQPISAGKIGTITNVMIFRCMDGRPQIDPYRPDPRALATAMRLDGVTVEVVFDGEPWATWCFHDDDITSNLHAFDPLVRFQTRYIGVGINETHPAFTPPQEMISPPRNYNQRLF